MSRLRFRVVFCLCIFSAWTAYGRFAGFHSVMIFFFRPLMSPVTHVHVRSSVLVLGFERKWSLCILGRDCAPSLQRYHGRKRLGLPESVRACVL